MSVILSILSILAFVSSLNAQEIQYSNSNNTNMYTISAPDNSTRAVFSANGGRALKLSINGQWNRLTNDIPIEDRTSQFYNFDFAFGTYTSLINNTQRPVYQIVTNSNQITMNASAIIDQQKIIISRTISFLENGQISEQLSLSNASGKNMALDFEGLAFTFSSLFDISRATTNNSNIPEYRYMDEKKLKKANIHAGGWFSGAKPMEFIADPKWMTLADNFFLAVVQPNFSNIMAIYNGFEFTSKSRVNMAIQVLATNIPANQSLDYNLQYFVGPRVEKTAALLNKEYKKLFAWPAVFNWILKPIESGTIWLMSSLVNFTGNAGVTLILIGILVKLLLLPLSIKSAISMKKMRLLQPKLNKLQEKWGHDPQALQMKTMELYRSEKVNPLGGCLPLLLQIPVFFALFRVLSRSVELRGANFLWISDLTMPDSLFTIGSFSFHILPIIMTLLQLVTVFRQQGRMGESQNEMQKQMQTQSYLMPVIFLFLFWSMPAGLVIYWTVQNVISILEQEVINVDKKIK